MSKRVISSRLCIGHLRVGDHIVHVLTMKEEITETRPLVLDVLLKIPANFFVVTEWTPLPADKARKKVHKRRRHFNMSKTGFVSQMGNDVTKTNPRVLVDESKQADIENLGDCLRALGDGQSLGDFSLTIGAVRPFKTRTGAARGGVHWPLHQRRWESFFRNLQPAQRLPVVHRNPVHPSHQMGREDCARLPGRERQ
jgi:hypothetical protein